MGLSCGDSIGRFLGYKDGEDPTFKISNYTGHEIRTDGYYIGNCDSSTYQIYIFYRNGALNEFAILRKENGREIPYEVIDSRILNTKKYEAIHYWGVYYVKSDNINMEVWGSSLGRRPLTGVQARILNDTTFFRETKYFVRDTSHIWNSPCTLSFRSLPCKPDSMTDFISYKINNQKDQ